MLHQIHNHQQNQIILQNLRNKTTVKKQKNLFNQLNRFNMPGKQNQFNQNNLITQQIKTIARKQNQQENQIQKVCANHQDKQAQFLVKIDGEILKYCRKCATQIASQGFQVQKISQTKRQSSVHGRNPSLFQNISPNRLRQKQQSKKVELTEFVKKLKNLRTQYTKKQGQLKEISQSYQIQKQNIKNYYTSLIEYIQDMRDTHIQAIQQQSIHNTQICEIQAGQVTQTLNQIDTMIHDIQSNMENIINEVDQESYTQCLSFYRQKQGIFNHRIQELGAQAKPWRCTQQKALQNKFQSFKIFIDELHGLQQNQEQDHNRIYNY